MKTRGSFLKPAETPVFLLKTVKPLLKLIFILQGKVLYRNLFDLKSRKKSLQNRVGSIRKALFKEQVTA
jgi:hypothetical protein